MKKYALAILSMRISNSLVYTNLNVIFVFADTEKEAEKEADIYCKKYFPYLDGYASHAKSHPVEVLA